MADKTKGFRVMRTPSWGAKPGVAANNLSQKEAEDYVSMQQENGDGAQYTIEKDS